RRQGGTRRRPAVVVSLGQPGRRGLRRAVPLRRRPARRRAPSRLRLRRPPLPRRPPRPPGADGVLHRSPPPAGVDRAGRARGADPLGFRRRPAAHADPLPAPALTTGTLTYRLRI